MLFTHIFNEDLVLFNPANVENKKNCLELIATAVFHKSPGLKLYELFNALYNRELIGSTLVRPGIAIPHARVKNLKYPIGVITRLKTPIPFTENKEQTVKLLFSLFVSTEAQEEHLNLLAQLATKIRDENWTERLLSAESKEALWAAFCG
jgi:PTS system nitrogen regulatory IIA component